MRHRSPPVHIAVNAHREPAYGAGVADFHADMAKALDKPQPGNDGHRVAVADMLGWDRIRCSPHVEYTGDDSKHLSERKPRRTRQS